MITRTVQSGVSPQEIRILADKVLTASNVREVTASDRDGTIMYEYTQTEYTKDEYIKHMQNRLAHNTANIDYIAMMTDVDLDSDEDEGER